jgi:hypothetical protein
MKLWFQVKTLWHGDKDNAACPFDYAPLPPRGLDGYGLWFATAEDNTLWIVNTNHHCLIRVRSRKGETLKNPLAPTYRMVGGCSHNGGLATLMSHTQSKQPDMVVKLCSKGQPLSTLTLEEAVELAPPVWLRFHPVRKSWLCTHRGFQLRGGVYPTTLFEYSAQTGKRLRTIENLTGVALSSSGMLYLSGDVVASEGVVPVKPPRGTDSKQWLLVGVDAQERLYWYFQERSGRWHISRLACSDPHGRSVWEKPLTGTEGILGTVDPHLQVRLGWGCEWLEVLADGSIVVFAWSASEKVREGVGVYQVSWRGS